MIYPYLPLVKTMDIVHMHCFVGKALVVYDVKQDVIVVGYVVMAKAFDRVKEIAEVFDHPVCYLIRGPTDRLFSMTDRMFSRNFIVLGDL
jgi:hypothetical protein